MFWAEEHIQKDKYTKKFKISLCCQEGKVSLPLLQPTHPYLDILLEPKGSQLSARVREKIRIYNSMFAFTSIGAKIDHTINERPGHIYFVWVVKIIIELVLYCPH